MKAQHEMPFGAQIGKDGSTRFRLWAPAAHQVEIWVQPEGAAAQLLRLAPRVGGWHELITDHAPHGTRYRYRIDRAHWVPDPASRFNGGDVHAPSQVVDPRRFTWRDTRWRGRPWHEAVIYELHVGTFSPAGTYAGAAERLDYLAELGVTAIELMPVADFPGSRGWGYDGALLYCPEAAYGSPDDLRGLVEAAHQKGLMVFLDVVYNHFGPEGNYLHLYAPQFFTRDRETDWGSAIDFSGPESRVVRDFFIHNALYWLEEYRFDGLRFDAVHSITDHSDPDILMEIAQAVHAGPGRERTIHLVLENHANQARYLREDPKHPAARFDAQWNDDIHHAAHVILTAEQGGYYADYVDDPVGRFARCLIDGFAYQGEPSRFGKGRPRGEPSSDLPAACFVNFLQNHDQVGNRALGERISMLAAERPLRATLAALLLAPSPLLLFMGEEFAADTPFLFFCDFNEDLARSVREGRQRQFDAFREQQGAPVAPPDPNDPLTFAGCKLRWGCLGEPLHKAWLDFYRELLRIRKLAIVPRIPRLVVEAKSLERKGSTAFRIQWATRDGERLHLLANLGEGAVHGLTRGAGVTLFSTEETARDDRTRSLGPWVVEWSLQRA